MSINEPIAQNLSSFIDALKTGSSTAIIGMLIVFAVLAVIFVALVIMRKALHKKQETPVAAPAPKAAPAPTAPVEEETSAEEPVADDGAIIAAIMAAISAHTGKALTSFRVVSFKRRH